MCQVKNKANHFWLQIKWSGSWASLKLVDVITRRITWTTVPKRLCIYINIASLAMRDWRFSFLLLLHKKEAQPAVVLDGPTAPSEIDDILVQHQQNTNNTSCVQRGTPSRNKLSIITTAQRSKRAVSTSQLMTADSSYSSTTRRTCPKSATFRSTDCRWENSRWEAGPKNHLFELPLWP